MTASDAPEPSPRRHRVFRRATPLGGGGQGRDEGGALSSDIARAERRGRCGGGTNRVEDNINRRPTFSRTCGQKRKTSSGETPAPPGTFTLARHARCWLAGCPWRKGTDVWRAARPRHARAAPPGRHPRRTRGRGRCAPHAAGGWRISDSLGSGGGGSGGVTRGLPGTKGLSGTARARDASARDAVARARPLAGTTRGRGTRTTPTRGVGRGDATICATTIPVSLPETLPGILHHPRASSAEEAEPAEPAEPAEEAEEAEEVRRGGAAAGTGEDAGEARARRSGTTSA